MMDLDSDYLPHLLAFLIFLGRVGDIRSTRLVTPTLKLEANPIARRFHRIVFPAGFVLCLVPYLHPGLGIQIAVSFLLVAAANFSRVWIARAIGETEYLTLLQQAAQRSSFPRALSSVFMSAFFSTVLGLTMVVLSRGIDSADFWIAIGFLTYVLTMVVHSLSFLRRLFHANAPP